MENLIKNIAVDEVLNPSLDLTKQLLRVCPLSMRENFPVIEDMIFSKDSEYAEVYFQLEYENYYLVVYVDLTPELSLRTVGTSAGNYIDLVVSSNAENVNELIRIAEVKPISKWSKGEKIGKTEDYYEESGFIYRLNEKMTGEVENKIKELLEFLFMRKEIFKKLSEISCMDISIFYCGYKEQMWGINLSKETIKMLSEFNLSIDIDLYASGTDLE